MKLYVPFNNINNYRCYAVFDSNTIRAYYNEPQLGNNTYTDIYVNSHYLTKEGTQVIESTQELPLCTDISQITNDYWHRLDLAHIIVITMFFLIFIFLTYKIFSRMFGRWLKL